jgi:diguanylate cyclase (GGDEF)-like protein
MNGLKLTNDVFGHEQGDRLLVRLAQVLKSTCRNSDVIARWGGDEFIVLLPGSSASDCEQVCSRIREALQAEEPDPIPLRAAMGAAVKDSGKRGIGEVFSAAESRMYSEKLLSAKSVRQTILSSMGQTLTKRCHESAGHIQRVHALAVGFSLHLGLKSDSVECKQIDLLAPLHDIGKVSIPREILEKPDLLNPDEWEIIKSHSEIGGRLAQAIGETGLADIIIALHERWDGTGYPYGFSGSQIPYMARLFSIVDVFDVVTHERPYRRAVNVGQAVAIIRDGAGSQFDPELALAFIQFVSSKNIGEIEEPPAKA